MPAAHPIIPLDRRFRRESEEYDPDQEDFLASMADVDKRKNGEGWEDVLAHRVSVIRGDAGAGKSTECERQAQLIRGKGGRAFAAQLDDLALGKLSFLSAGDEQGYQQWRAEGGEAHIFLDALDEVRLVSGLVEAPLKRALAAVREHTSGVLTATNARLIISTRPAEWHDEADTVIVQEHFHFLDPEAEVEPVIYRITALNRERIAKLLPAFKIELVDVPAVLASIDHAQAAGFFRQPLDIKLLADAWRDAVAQGKSPQRAFIDRTDLFNRAVDSQLRETGVSEPRMNMSLDRARLAAERLAALSVLTGEQDLRALAGKGGIDAIGALGSIQLDWTPLESRRLLSTALFAPGRGDLLRFAHREVRDFLAARFFAAAIRRSGGSLDPIAPLIGHAFGVELISDASVGVLAWLSALDEGAKARVSDLRPEILIQGGDPLRLTDGDRMRALSSIVERIGEQLALKLRAPPA